MILVGVGFIIVSAAAAFSADAAAALSAAAVILFHTHVLISGVFSDHVYVF